MEKKENDTERKEGRKRGEKHTHEHPYDLTLDDFILILQESRAQRLSRPKSPSQLLCQFPCTPTDLQHDSCPLPPAFIFRKLLSKLPPLHHAVLLLQYPQSQRAKKHPHKSPTRLSPKLCSSGSTGNRHPPALARAQGGKCAGSGAPSPRTCVGAAGSCALPPHPLAAAAGSASGTPPQPFLLSP